MRSSKLKFSPEIVEKNLPTLRADEAIAFKLHFIDNKTIKDISQELGLPRYIIKQRIAKAIFELRKATNDPEYIKAIQILRSK